MPFNREILASITFEPGDGSDWDNFDKEPSIHSDDDSSDGDEELRRIGGLQSNPGVPPNRGDEDEHQNEATKRVIKCLKIALAKSITSISQPEKERPLDPKRDFSIQTTMEFSVPRSTFNCCGTSATSVKRRRGRERRQRSIFNVFDHEDDSYNNSLSGDRDGRNQYRDAYHEDDGLYGDEGGLEPGPRQPRPSQGLQQRVGGLTAMMRPASTGSFYFDGRRRHYPRRPNVFTPQHTTDDDDDDDDDEEDRPPVNFKFIDYSPMCYRHIREFFNVDPKAYCDVLRYSRWHSIPTPGKSAAQLFFCGRDWVIKTMTVQESDFLRDILHRYYYHVRDNPFTLLPHFVGHHQLVIGTVTHNFIIMQNVFATTNTIHEKFDLKGSTIGRFASDAEKLRATCTQKDLDIHNPIHIGSERRKVLIDQIKKDCDFLKQSMIMDYSFLVGIHVLPSAGSMVGQPTVQENLGGTTNPAAFSGTAMISGMDAAAAHFNRSFAAGGTGAAQGLLAAAATTAALGLDRGVDSSSGFDLHSSGPVSGRCFTSNEGGMLSNEVPGLRREIYYIGIIDILQEFNTRKTLEHYIYGAMYDRKRISCVHPNDYASRFVAFMSSVIV